MTFYELFPVLYYHSTLNDHLVFVVLICYLFCAALMIKIFYKCLMKGAMSVEQIALSCSGPPLSSNVLYACILRVAYVSTLMSLQQHGQTPPNQSSV